MIKSDAQRERAVAQIKLALDADEEKAIELKRELVNGQERAVWNPSIPAKEFDFTDAEVVRIKAAIEKWDGYGVRADRKWLEPLLGAFVSPEPSSDLCFIRKAHQARVAHYRRDGSNPVLLIKPVPTPPASSCRALRPRTTGRRSDCEGGADFDERLCWAIGGQQSALSR